jgi:hypothetical protein
MDYAKLICANEIELPLRLGFGYYKNLHEYAVICYQFVERQLGYVPPDIKLHLRKQPAPGYVQINLVEDSADYSIQWGYTYEDKVYHELYYAMESLLFDFFGRGFETAKLYVKIEVISKEIEKQ